MEPNKAKRTIVFIICIATILVFLCLALLFHWIRLPWEKKKTEMPRETVYYVETYITPTPTEIPAPAPAPTPGPDDLKGTSNSLYHPKEESYLPHYETMIVNPQSGKSNVYLQLKPERIVNSTDALMKLNKNMIVTALAKENGYTLVLVQEGVAGWVKTQELETLNYDNTFKDSEVGTSEKSL